MSHNHKLEELEVEVDEVMAVVDNEDGFVDVGKGKGKEKDTMGDPLIPPASPARKKRPLDYLVCVLVVVS